MLRLSRLVLIASLFWGGACSPSSSQSNKLQSSLDCNLEFDSLGLEIDYIPQVQIIKNNSQETRRFLVTTLSKKRWDFIFNEEGKICWNIGNALDFVSSPFPSGQYLVQTGDYVNDSGGVAPPYHRSQILLKNREGEVLRQHSVREGIHHSALALQDLHDGVWLLASNSHANSGDEEDLLLAIHKDNARYSLPLASLLDPTRPRTTHGALLGDSDNREYDWAHLNSIDYNPQDDSLVLSLRNQSAVVKLINGNPNDLSAYQVAWILGEHTEWKSAYQPKLLQAQDGFDEGVKDWPHGQHSVIRIPSSDEKIHILLFDNALNRNLTYPLTLGGNDEANPPSRVVEYSIDEDQMTVSLTWEYQNPRYKGSNTRGSVALLPNGNRLIFWPDGGSNQSYAIVEEVDRNKNTIFEAHITAKHRYTHNESVISGYSVIPIDN